MIKKFIQRRIVIALASLVIAILVSLGVSTEIPCAILEALAIPVESCEG